VFQAVRAISLSENEHIRHRIYDIYSDFVKFVDPKGFIMDYLIQNRIVSEELAEQLCGIATRQERCRAMLHELLNSGKPRAFVILRKALEEHHDFIVHMIDKATTGAF